MAHAEDVRLLGGCCVVPVPEGWRTDTSYGDAGLLIYPPDGLAWPVELAIWDIPEGAANTARAAVLAHEAAMRRNYTYTHRDSKDFATISGSQGLLVTGELQLPDESSLAVAFVAYAAADRYFAIGTFSTPGQLEATLARNLTPIARNISFGVSHEKPQTPPSTGPSTAAAVDPKHDAQVTTPATERQANNTKPEISTPGKVAPLQSPSVGPSTAATVDPKHDAQVTTSATERQANNTKPEVSTPGKVAPLQSSSVAPATATTVAPKHDAQVTTLQDWPETTKFTQLEAGALHMLAPEGFVLEELDGKWLAHPSGMNRLLMGVAIWPLVIDGTETAEELARGILSKWDVSAKAPMKYRQTGDEVFFGGRGDTVAGKYRIIGSCKTAGDSALLRAAYVMDDRATAEWATLPTMLANIQIGPIPINRKRSGPAVDMWQMPEYPALRFPIPAGWRARGHVKEYGGLWALKVEALDPGPARRYIVWHQPITPMFRELTTLLQGLGYKELDSYTSEAGSQAVLLSRVGPEEFVQNYYNQHTRTTLTNANIVEAQDSEHVRRLVNAADSSGAYIVCEGESVLGRRRNTYLVASGNAFQAGLHNWQAAIIEASEPVGDNGAAIAALQSMVEGVVIDKEQGEVPFGLSDVLRRAKEAVSVLPVITIPDVLATGSAIELAASDGSEKWNIPAGAGVIWEKAVSALHTDAGPAEILPELDILRH